MLIVISKYIFKPDHFNDIHYHKYHHHHHHLQIPCQSVSEAARWHQRVRSCAFLKCDWRPIFSDTRSFSMLRVLSPRRAFSLYHSVSGFLIVTSEALRRSSFMEALATWQNKYHWFRWWLISPEKPSLESHLLVQIAFPFKIKYIFQKMLRNSNWEICISNNNKNNLDFFYCFEFSFYIF